MSHRQVGGKMSNQHTSLSRKCEHKFTFRFLSGRKSDFGILYCRLTYSTFCIHFICEGSVCVSGFSSTVTVRKLSQRSRFLEIKDTYVQGLSNLQMNWTWTGQSFNLQKMRKNWTSRNSNGIYSISQCDVCISASVTLYHAKVRNAIRLWREYARSGTPDSLKSFQ